MGKKKVAEHSFMNISEAHYDCHPGSLDFASSKYPRNTIVPSIIIPFHPDYKTFFPLFETKFLGLFFKV